MSGGATGTRHSGMVSVDDLEAGMLLAEDVRDQQGRLLMPAATELTDRHLRAFQLWGILGVKIRQPGEPDADAPLPVAPELQAAADAAVRVRMRHNDLADPVIAELFRLCVEREGQRLARSPRG